MCQIKTVMDHAFGQINIAALDRIYEIDGRCLGKVTKNGYTTIYTGSRKEDVLRFWRVATIKD